MLVLIANVISKFSKISFLLVCPVQVYLERIFFSQTKRNNMNNTSIVLINEPGRLAKENTGKIKKLLS